jgi:hypothetical protein
MRISRYVEIKVARGKQLGQTTAKAPAQPEQETISDEDSYISEEKIADAPPPKIVVHPALTGRIRPEWKGNGKLA